MRRVLVTIPVVVSLLLAVPTADASDPASGTVDRATTSVTWTGSAPIQTAGLSGLGCQQAVPDPTCDTFTLEVGDLAAVDEDGAPLPDDDVLVAIATPDVPAGQVVEFDLYVYDADGTEVGHGTELGSNDTVTLRNPVAGTYAVAVQSVLSTDPTATYEGSASVVVAGDSTVVDEPSQCGMEDAPAARQLDRDANVGAVGVVGNPTVLLDADDPGDTIALDVLVILDGTTQEHAEQIFAEAKESYVPLHVDLRIAEFRIHEFLDRAGEPEIEGLSIIRQAKALLGGTRPDGIDIVEVLTNRDIQQLGQAAVAGIADCIGGVAYDDRAFLVAESDSVQDVAIGPAVFDYHAQAHVTAHEIGHLMGGQHHYANCVEGIDATDVHEDEGYVEGTPCTLMFNAADFLGGDFDTLNGRIVRATANRYARP